MQLGDIHIRFDRAASGGWTRPAPLGRPSKLLICTSFDSGATLTSADGGKQQWRDPLEALRWLDQHRSGGRWAGYLSYDLGRAFERIPSVLRDDLDLPLFVFTWHALPYRGGNESNRSNWQPVPREGPRSTFTKQGYVSAVRAAMDYIAAGDVFQVNLSQRFTTAQPAAIETIYEKLQTTTPAHYGALLDYGSFALLSNSPELFLKVATDRGVTTRPIKGTRKRQSTLDDELRSSTKDEAELNMIVDLERNDIGRVCEIGSVRVAESRTIEAHPTVYHGVATVEGTLRNDVDLVDLLRATFPGGSITGAPKIRAMEIIEELEPVRRGPYCGAIGYLDDDGTMEFNIAIRTMIVKDGRVHVPVGGGIVADSQSEAEYEETLVKARAMFDALGVDLDQACP